MKRGFTQFFWPPLRADRTNRKIRTRRQQEGETIRWQRTHRETMESLAKYSDLSTIIEATSELGDSESKRKDTLETKASVIVQSGGIAVSIVALAPALLGKPWSLSFWWTAAVLLFYFLAILHLLVAVYYAVQARRVGSYAMLSATSLMSMLNDSSQKRLIERIVAEKISNARWNEGALTIKANDLSVAEDMLLRGLAFFATSVSIAILEIAVDYISHQFC